MSKIKWPKSEEKEFGGGRWFLVPVSGPPPPLRKSWARPCAEVAKRGAGNAPPAKWTNRVHNITGQIAVNSDASGRSRKH